MELGRKCKWEEIKVGEVFAWEGCWQIAEKRGRDTAFVVADNDVNCPDGTDDLAGEETTSWDDSLCVYKLPKSVQSLWIGK